MKIRVKNSGCDCAFQVTVQEAVKAKVCGGADRHLRGTPGQAGRHHQFAK